MAKKIIRLTESDLTRIVTRVIEEQTVAGAVANTAQITFEITKLIFKIMPATTIASLLYDALTGNTRGVLGAVAKYKSQLGKDYNTIVNAITKGDLSKFAKQLSDAAKQGLG